MLSQIHMGQARGCARGASPECRCAGRSDGRRAWASFWYLLVEIMANSCGVKALADGRHRHFGEIMFLKFFATEFTGYTATVATRHNCS